MKKLKRILIKEELVELTGDFKLAIVLGQMIYWTEKVSDIDKYITEEKKRYATFATNETDIPTMDLSNGWIYKSAEELSEETMMNVQAKAMREYLKELVDKGWLSQRRNPKIKMDRTLQYRVNLAKIQSDLLALGYNLDGYAIHLQDDAAMGNESEKNEVDSKGEKDTSIFLKEKCKREKEKRKVEKENTTGEKEKRKGEKEEAIPETTTEITTEIITETITSSENPPEGAPPEPHPEPSVPYEKIRKLFNDTCDMLPKVERITAERKKHIGARFKEYGNRIEIFEKLFSAVRESDYLTGKVNGWSADFDWLMKENNMTKVLEGKYANKVVPKKEKETVNPYKTKFHFDNDRSSQYTSDEWEAMILESQKKKFGTPVQRTDCDELHQDPKA